jgi:hypothetical protein
MRLLPAGLLLAGQLALGAGTRLLARGPLKIPSRRKAPELARRPNMSRHSEDEDQDMLHLS